MEICCNGGADVLSPGDSEGARSIGCVEEAGNVRSGAVIVGAVDARICGFLVGTGGDD